MKTTHPAIDERASFQFGSPHRRHWQFALLAGIGMEVIIAVSAFFAMLVALITAS